jgi:hypothetical protein
MANHIEKLFPNAARELRERQEKEAGEARRNEAERLKRWRPTFRVKRPGRSSALK